MFSLIEKKKETFAELCFSDVLIVPGKLAIKKSHSKIQFLDSW